MGYLGDETKDGVRTGCKDQRMSLGPLEGERRFGRYGSKLNDMRFI
jgi:hypothetical protein